MSLVAERKISNFHERQEQASSFQLKSPQRFFFGYALIAESGWDGRLTRGRYRKLKDNIASEVHVKRIKEQEFGIQKVREQFTFFCAEGSIKMTEEGLIRHTTIRSYSILVEDISGCLFGEVIDGSNLVKEQDAMEAKRDFCSMSGSFIYRHLITNRKFQVCLEKKLFLSH